MQESMHHKNWLERYQNTLFIVLFTRKNVICKSETIN